MKSKRFQMRWFWSLVFLFWGTLQTLPIYAQDIGQIKASVPRATEGTSADPLAVGPVVYLSYRIDDDNGGASNGNGNGIAESGERVELMVTVINQGNQTATVVLGELGTTDSDVNMFDTVCDWPDIPGGADTGGRGTNFGFEVNSNLYQDKSVRFGLRVQASNGGPWSSPLDVPIYASPRLRVTPTLLDFGETLTQLTFNIENGGA